VYLKLKDLFKNGIIGNCEATYWNGTATIVVESSYLTPHHWGKKGNF
jgi:hypothetical protein